MMQIIFTFLSLIFAHAAVAQQDNAPIVNATLVADAPAIKTATPMNMAVVFGIQQDWHVYWQNPGDSGMPTQITWNDLPEGVSISDMAWPVPERLPYGTLVNYGYSNRVMFPFTVTSATDMPALTITGKASWLVCKDICIPESAALSITLPAANADIGIAIDAARDSIPTASISGSYSTDEDATTITIPFTPELGTQLGDIANATWYPLDDGLIQNVAPQTVSINPDNLVISASRGTATPGKDYHGVVVLNDAAGDTIQTYQATLAHTGTLPPEEITPTQNTTEISAPVIPPSPAPDLPTGLLEALLLAFIGGLILNLMPCVLPVLSLKALALAKKAEASKGAALLQGLSYTAGVVLSFVAIAALLISLTQAGNAIGWGFQLQSPEVIAGLALLMVMVALNLFGLFEWPTLFGNTSGLTTPDSAGGSFFTGMLAVAVATPCTAPFMAPALGFAALQPAADALAIFVALGFGLAAPFLLISAVPAARRILPKPGAWMITFKQAMAFPMLATAMWLLWVQVQLNQAMGLAITLAGMLLLGFWLWLRGRAPKYAWLWLVAATGTIIGTMIYQPPVQTMPLSSDNSAVNQVVYNETTLQSLRDKGVPVFVDATAAWCITCKINEQTSLRDSDVEDAFIENGVTMMIADWTTADADITAYLAKYGRNGVPLYVYYAPGKEGVILPQILTPSIVIEAISNR